MQEEEGYGDTVVAGRNTDIMRCVLLLAREMRAKGYQG